MKWLIVVVFANLAPNGDKELFVFTNPTFDDPIVCQSDISNPQVIPLLVQKIMEEEGPRPIERVLCLPEKSVKDMMNSYKKEKGTSA
jgi:hypothetical protein